MNENEIIYNGKWDGIWDQKKYCDIREKVTSSFNELIFIEEGHKYFLNGKEMTCVSDVTHLFKPEFDVNKMSRKMYLKYYHNPGSQYFHKTVDEIKEMWSNNSKAACEHGTERHEYGESCFYFMTGQYDKILPAFKDRLVPPSEPGGKWGFKALYPKEFAINRLYNDLPVCVVPILAETKVYDNKLGYSGTFDILFYYDATLNGRPECESGLYIFDWKTNKDLYKDYGMFLDEPFETLPASSLSLYKLQLSLYQNCLENIGMKIISRCLFWLREDGTYQKIRLENYVEKLKTVLTEIDLVNNRDKYIHSEH